MRLDIQIIAVVVFNGCVHPGQRQGNFAKIFVYQGNESARPFFSKQRRQRIERLVIQQSYVIERKA